jgi:superfamily I DNA/RNA helicase
MSWDQLCQEAALCTSGKPPFGHVIADEFQDLGASDLRFLRSLVKEGEDDLFLCGDSGQRIYKASVSWLSLGIDVRGRSASLNVNYRTTEQIRRFADRILKDPEDASTGEAEQRRSVSLLSGPEPQVQACGTVAEEIASAAGWIRSLLADGYEASDIGIFAHGQSILKNRAQPACEAAAVRARELSDDDSAVPADGVAMGTMHRAKGLEFKAVLVMGCDEKVLPLKSALERMTDQADRDSFIEQERRLLYVACTRARERLLLTHSGPKSEFL